MNLLLLILLILELPVIYYINGKNIVSPSFIGCCGFILSAFVLNLSGDFFQYDIHAFTVFIILITLIIILLGEKFANKIGTTKFSLYRVEEQESIITISSFTYIVLFLFVIVSGYLYLQDAYVYSLKVGNSVGGYFSIARYTRFVGGYSPSTILGQASVLSESIVYFCMYVFFYNLVLFKKRNLVTLLPLTGFVFHILVNDGRSAIIKYFCVSCIMYFVIYKQANGWKKEANKKLLRIGICSVLAFLVVFRILGYRTGTSINNALWDNLSEYLSSGIVGLDISTTAEATGNQIFGQNTFKAIYETLRGWGANVPIINANREFFSFAQGTSNVYTGIDGYILDFGLIGAFFAFFLWGAVIKWTEKRVKKCGLSLIWLYFIGLLYYPVTMLSIAGATHVVLCMPTIYTIVYLWLLQQVLIYKRVKVK
ncbi:MAG: oligosaccharide repeat unit polymerase [Clostridia bacterium]|nr:oligosaccharide repeat unit polymerase [Clostridia bacterium]